MNKEYYFWLINAIVSLIGFIMFNQSIYFQFLAALCMYESLKVSIKK